MCAMLTYNMLDPDRIEREISDDSPDHHILSIHQKMQDTSRKSQGKKAKWKRWEFREDDFWFLQPEISSLL